MITCRRFGTLPTPSSKLRKKIVIKTLILQILQFFILFLFSFEESAGKAPKRRRVIIFYVDGCR